jgi:hypothetical protein
MAWYSVKNESTGTTLPLLYLHILTKSRRMRRTGPAEQMGDMKSAYKLLVGIPEEGRAVIAQSV